MSRKNWQRWWLLLPTSGFALLLLGQTFLSSGRWIDRTFPGFFVHQNLTVGPYFLPGWSGAAGGIESLDRLVSVNGVRLRSRAELYNLARSLPPGSPFRYELIRDGRLRELTVATMPFGLRDWLFSFGVYMVIGLAFLVIGVAPYFFRASSPAALPLGFMVFAVFVWFQTTFDFMTEGWLPKELRIFALALTPSAAIHLASLLRRGASGGSLRPLYTALIYGAGAALGALQSWTYFGPLDAWIAAFRAGYFYVCAGAVSFLVMTARALGRVESDLERSRLRVVFGGALLGFLIPALTTVLTSSFHLPVPYNLALIPTVFFPVSVAYALLKYSLFDLGNAFRIGLTRVALMALLTAIYAGLAFFAAPWAGPSIGDPLVPIFFSILVVAIFNPLLRWLEGIVDRYVYRQDYDSARVQQEISLFLRSLDSAPAVAQGFVERIGKSIGSAGALIVYRAKNTARCLAAAGSLKENAAAATAEAERLGETWRSGVYSAVARSEVSTDPRFQEGKESLLAFLDRRRVELLLPLVYEREVRGVALFGAKRSGREYSAEDLRLLQTLTDQLALSLENGRLYEESVAARRGAEASNKKLMEMDRVKKDFVANLCHELRTPVSTIIGYGEILRELNVGEEGRRILDRLVSNGQDLSALMDNLMNFSRMEADGSAAQFEIVKLNEILSGLEMMTRRLIRERPIQFGIRRESPVEAIESDGGKLQQILVQLLTNALKFTEKGRVELSIRSVNGARGDFIEIGVADTGIGICPEDQALIFEDFRQLDGSSRRQYGGTGLGLGLCKKLAAALGGEIRVTSEIGVGSIFSLLLPVRASASADKGYAEAMQPLP
jgi:signal transduction histidine kinase